MGSAGEDDGWRSSVALLAVLGVGVAHAARYAPFVTDDTLISLRYAWRLNRGLGLTWTDGEAVEGYSNLLWVLLCAAVEWVGVDLLDATRLWGVLGLVVAVAVASVDPVTLRPRTVRALSGGLLLALTGSLAAWAMGGLSHTFLSGLVGAAVLAVMRAVERPDGRARWVAALLLSAAVLTRADGAVLWVGAGLGWFLADPRGIARAWPAVFLPAACLLGQQVFRLAYYGDWIPNTARVKVSATWARTQRGLWWTSGGLISHAALVCAAFGGWLVARRDRAVMWVPATTAAVWIAYVAWVGGDIFEAWRQLVPALACLGILASEAASRLRPVALFAAAAPVLTAHLVLSNTGRDLERPFDKEWVLVGRPVGKALKRAFGHRRPLLAVDAAGSLPFYAELPVLDMLGLNDPWLPRNPPPHFGTGRIGHDLGNGDYVWSREPELVVFNSTVGGLDPHYLSGKELLARRDWRRRYQPLKLDVSWNDDTWTAGIWVRREGGALGVVRSEDAVEIPGWLLATDRAHASPGRPGQLPVTVRPDRPGQIAALRVPAGRWTLQAPEKIAFELGCPGGSASPLAASAGADAVQVLQLDGPTPIDVLVWPTDDRARLREVTLVRTDAPATHTCRPTPTVPLPAVAAPVPDGISAYTRGVVRFGRTGVLVTLPEPTPSHDQPAASGALELSLSRGRRYVVRWLAGDRLVALESVEVERGAGLAVIRVEPPGDIDAFDAIEVRTAGAPAALGHVTLLPAP